MKKIKSEYTLRIRDKRLLDRLQEMLDDSKFTSYNTFLNHLLSQVAFKERKEDEIIEKLDEMDTKLNAITERMK